MDYPVIDTIRTGVRIKQLMEEQNLTAEDVRRALMLGSVQSVYHWMNGTSLPAVDNLYALSLLLQVPMEEILCLRSR